MNPQKSNGVSEHMITFFCIKEVIYKNASCLIRSYYNLLGSEASRTP